MQIVTWPSGKAALNIIKRRQQKQTRRQDTGNVFSLLVSSGRSGMIECWCLPGPLQTIVPPPSKLVHTCTPFNMYAQHLFLFYKPTHTCANVFLSFEWQETSRWMNRHCHSFSSSLFLVEGIFRSDAWFYLYCVPKNLFFWKLINQTMILSSHECHWMQCNVYLRLVYNYFSKF